MYAMQKREDDNGHTEHNDCQKLTGSVKNLIPQNNKKGMT